MRLRTELKIVGPRRLDFSYTKSGLSHDAIASHALWMAIEAAEEEGIGQYGTNVNPFEWIRIHAGQLILEWGLGED